MFALDNATKLQMKEKRVDAFVHDCIAKLKIQDPFHTQSAGDAAVEATVRLGLARGRKYGITATSSVTLYIQIMILLGSYFDVDPMYPWAAERLNHPQEGDTQTDTMNRLRDDMLDTVRRTSGENGEISLAVLSRVDKFLSQETPKVIATPEMVKEHIAKLCPERVTCMGSEALDHVITNVMAEAELARVAGLQAVVAMALLSVIYGFRVFDDPFYGWARDVLTKARIHNTPDRLVLRVGQTFFAKTKTYITERLENE